MKNFRTYQAAVEFYRLAATAKLPRHLKDQLDRAASSIVLNLAEGAGRFGRKDQKRFFHIALGSLRECQAIIDIAQNTDSSMELSADKLGAHIFKLIRS
ncbi:MAG: four helix bundle protein [Bdellovibrionales bacterium]|nr:four helix bundle protein [Bdellovibrionales bacterium]